MDQHAENRRQIDAEIAILEQRLLFLRAQHNRLAPISCLPVETMVRIFRFAYACSSTTLPIVLSSVSRDWRELAMDLPEIWGTIDNQLKLKHIPAYMALSRQKPLDVSLDDLSANNVDKIIPVLKELPRIRILKLENSTDVELVKCSGAVWRIQAPILEALDLYSFQVPKFIFSGHAPLLLQLNLIRCKFDWNSLPALPQVRFLQICEPERTIPLDEFLSRVSLMPNLWNILTKRVLMRPRNTITMPQFVLPRLEVLDLEGERCEHVIEILRIMVLPQVEHLSLRLKPDNPDSELAILDAVNNLPVFSTLDVENLSLIGRRNFSGCMINDEPVIIFLQFRHTRRTTTRDLHRMVSHLKFNLEKVQELRVDLVDVEVEDYGASLWKLVNERTELESLAVRNDAIRVLAQYLSQEYKQLDHLLLNPSADEDVDEISPDVLSFYWLEQLSISGNGIPSQDYISYLDTISQYLRIRQRWEKGVQTLVISSDSPLPDQQTSALQEAVKEFRVLTYDLNPELDEIFDS